MLGDDRVEHDDLLGEGQSVEPTSLGILLDHLQAGLDSFPGAAPRRGIVSVFVLAPTGVNAPSCHTKQHLDRFSADTPPNELGTCLTADSPPSLPGCRLA